MTTTRARKYPRVRFLLAFLLGQTLLDFALLCARFHDTLVLPSSLPAPVAHGVSVTIAWLVGLSGWLRSADSFSGPGLGAKLPLFSDSLVALPIAFCFFFLLLLARRRARTPAAWARTTAFGAAIVHLAVLATVLEVGGSADSAALGMAWQSSGPILRETALALGVSIVAIAAASAWTTTVLRMALVGTAILAGLAVVVPTSERDPMPTKASPPPRATAGTEPDRPPNIVLISIDSLRADRLGCYGNARPVSPTIDRLAATGLRFTDAVATSPWTLPSHMSMLTGLDALEHGVQTELDRLPQGVATVAEVLREHGYQTAGIVSETLVGRTFGFARGFDTFDDTTAVAAMSALDEETAPVVTDLALRQLDGFAAAPFFLFLHYWDVHYDYLAPEPYRTMFDTEYAGTVDARDFIHNESINAHMPARDVEHLLALYDGEIRWVDDHLAQVVARLESSAQTDETVLIITSDHGDEFFEHGGKGHGITLYREVMQVPLIISGAGVANDTVAAPVSLVDIAATIYDLAGVDPSAKPRSSRSLLRWRDLPAGEAVFAARCLSYSPSCRFLRHNDAGSLLLSLWPFESRYFAATDREQRFNLAAAPGPAVQDAFAELVAGLNRQWQTHESLRRERQATTAAMRERLRTLGYDRTD